MMIIIILNHNNTDDDGDYNECTMNSNFVFSLTNQSCVTLQLNTKKKKQKQKQKPQSFKTENKKKIEFFICSPS